MKSIKFSNSAKLILWTLLIALPFLQRPLFVDDHARYAEALNLSQGKNFYTAGSHTLGWQTGQAPGEANPPFYFVVMSQVIRVLGTQLWKAHGVILLFTLLGALGFYGLARRFVAHPLWAAALWTVTPHVWLTANSLLLDSMLAPLLLAGLACWIEGWEKKNNLFCALGAILLGLAPLVKYTGLLGMVLAVLWVLIAARSRMSWQWLWLGIPSALFLAWIHVSRSMYGQSHFTAVAMDKMTRPDLIHALLLSSFIAATTPVLLLALPATFLHKKFAHRWWYAAGFSICFGLGFLFGGYTGAGLEMGFWCGSFGAWIVWVGAQPHVYERLTLFLILWAFLGALVLSVAIPWICARYLVILSPAFILLTVKTVETTWPRMASRKSARWLALAFFTGFGFALAAADAAQARFDQRAASDAETWRAQHHPHEAAYYAAASLGSIGYYLAQRGWQPLRPGGQVPAHALVILPRRSLPPLFWPMITRGQVVTTLTYIMKNPLRTLDCASGAGYYGSIWGPLPFAISRKPVEVYTLIET